MVELKTKVGPKGQIIIPKVLRDRYGIHEGDFITLELTDDGILARGRPSIVELSAFLKEHARKLYEKNTKSPKLGELGSAYLEMEFEE
jgi:AbrB family looped-hinge helix DNA binding protein